MNSPPPILFIVGTGRCGTQTFSHLLETSPKAFSMHEGRRKFAQDKRFNVGDMSGLNAAMYRGRQGASLLRDCATATGVAAQLMERCFASRVKLIEKLQIEGQTLVEVNRFAYHFIPYVASRFPEARFIHLVRDGYAVAKSWERRVGIYPSRDMLRTIHLQRFQNRYLHRNSNAEGLADWLCDLRNDFILRRSRYRERDLDLIASLDQRNFHWEKARPLPGEADYAAWRNWTRLQRIAWFWKEVNGRIEGYLSPLPEDRWRRVRIEDVEPALLASLFEFAGLPPPASLPEAKKHNRSVASSSSTWTESELQACTPIFAERMKDYGYTVPDTL